MTDEVVLRIHVEDEVAGSFDWTPSAAVQAVIGRLVEIDPSGGFGAQAQLEMFARHALCLIQGCAVAGPISGPLFASLHHAFVAFSQAQLAVGQAAALPPDQVQ